MKKIVGFIPSPGNAIGFGIPVYVDCDSDSDLYYHVLDEKSEKIVNFERVKETPVEMVRVPFINFVNIGDLAIFAISGKCEIFIGNIGVLELYAPAIIRRAGKNFIEEFKSILKIN
jgi:hypothetical protein